MFFETILHIRFRIDELKQIESIVKKNKDIESKSHLIRIAVIKYLREYKTGGKK